MAHTLPALMTRDGCFIDAFGRQVLLHGINLVNKNPTSGYMGEENFETFASFRKWGFNCVRLGVIWDGLEPRPGVFNESYLQGLDRQVAWARQNDLFVILDMHQDLYSVLFSDGAPRWATLTGDLPHEPGTVWSDAYFSSPAVQAAFDHFWHNAPAPDGVGLQDHYALAWQTLARRYASEPAVVGYDLMNEPFPGSAAAPVLPAMFQQGANLLRGPGEDPGQSLELMAARWLTEEGRFAILEQLADPVLFAQVIDVTQPIYGAFESGALMDLYCRLAQDIRRVDHHTILMLETSIGANMGVYSAISPVAVDGARDPQQAYAPHGYDLVVDTPYNARSGAGRVDLIFNRHAETARQHNWPLWVGEWGAYGRMPNTLPAARQVVRCFEALGCSDAYWCYEPGIEAFDCFAAVHRPYVERVAGRLEHYHYDPASGLFEAAWQENGRTGAPTILYLPGWFGFNPAQCEIQPSGSYQVEESEWGVWVKIPPLDSITSRSFRTTSAALC